VLQKVTVCAKEDVGSSLGCTPRTFVSWTYSPDRDTRNAPWILVDKPFDGTYLYNEEGEGSVTIKIILRDTGCEDGTWKETVQHHGHYDGAPVPAVTTNCNTRQCCTHTNRTHSGYQSL
jgi:hypothetical protein